MQSYRKIRMPELDMRLNSNTVRPGSYEGEYKKEAEALQWITTLLNAKKIPFVLCGGIAAFAYGAARPIHDIDLFVPGNHFLQTVDAGKMYTSKPAGYYKEDPEGWRIEYVQLQYEGVKIEIGNPEEAKIYDSRVHQWVDLVVDFDRITIAHIFNVEVPLMDKAALIAYKGKLGRPVDLEDIRGMTGNA